MVHGLSILSYMSNSEKKKLKINHLIYLQHFRDAWDGGKWEEKYKFEECHQKTPYKYIKGNPCLLN